MIDVGRLLLREIVSQTDRVGAKSPIFDLFSLVTVRREKVQLTLIESTTRFRLSPR